ncbi:MAG: UPF0182 family protein [Nocardioidaceae bacterium]|nr:UPF0182 family protein [Nocardioidaceae bacterium]
MSDDGGTGRGLGATAVTGAPAPRPSVLLPTLVTLGALLLLLAIFTGVWTDRLWFASIDYSSVFSTVLVTRVGLFAAGAVLLAGAAVLNIVLAYRSRPLVRVAARRNESLERYRAALEPVHARSLIAVGVLLGLVAGSVTAGQWQTFLLWRNGGDFDVMDTSFTSTDVGFFVFDYPWLRFVTSFGFALLTVSIIAAAVTHYLYGAIDLQARRDRLTGEAQTHLSILIGLFVLLKAWAYYLDRFSFALGTGELFDGIHYTDANARIPAKNILIVIAVICAVLLFVNAWRRSWLLPGIGLGLLALSSVLVSGVWPTIMQTFEVGPSVADKESRYIEDNIASTRSAYDIADVEPQNYDATTAVGASDLGGSQALPNTRLLDPTLVSPAFEQLQQVRGFYSVPPSLDVDRYTFDDSKYPQDVVVAAREIDLAGLDASQRNWTNDHTVYTHGYGVIAAYGDRRGPEGNPDWAESSIPPEGELTDGASGPYESRIYFGENTPDYSIVGNSGGSDVEVDFPTSGGSSSQPTLTTYNGSGGVAVDDFFTKALYSLKFGEPNIVLSGRVNDASKILYDRNPRERVETVAPWLTVDGNAYPAVVDGSIVWVVDGYTTSNSFPNAQRVSLQETTTDTLTATGGTAVLPSDQITYVRNSVKATVDAYTGDVVLYEWDETEPVLQGWMSAFPGTVKEKDEIPAELLEHLRYPEDLFKVQRDILSAYHVTNPGTFFAGTDKWAVPQDPSATASDTRQPPYYLSVQMPGEQTPAFSLTSVYTPNERENLAAFVAVNSVASDPDYGRFEILRTPADRIAGPSQIANGFQNDDAVATKLLSFRNQQDVSLQYGNLLTVPAGGGLLYVQPIYTQRSNVDGSFPQLQYVVASFGQEVGIGRSLQEALEDALGEPIDGTVDPPSTDGGGGDGAGAGDGGGDGGSGGGGANGTDTERALELLVQADQVYAEAQAALADNDLGAYQDGIEEFQALVDRAARLLDGAGGQPAADGQGT